MTVDFELNGQKFVALNGGPRFKFTEAISFVVNCETQEEIDYYWEKLTAKRYQLKYTDDFASATWMCLRNIRAADSDSLVFTDTPGLNDKRFYRLYPLID